MNFLSIARGFFFQFLILILFMARGYPQCAMCKAAAQQASSVETGSYNSGILYLMAFPYILFGLLGFLWYKQSRKNREKRESLESQIKKHLPTYNPN
jgi:hypothetical protein